MKKILSVVAVLFSISFVNCSAESMSSITSAIENICKAPTKELSKHYTVTVTGKTGVSVKLLKIKGKASFSKEEWKGYQRVIPGEQHKDNVNYRECVKELAPVFIHKFSTDEIKKDRPDKEESSNDTLVSNNKSEVNKKINIIPLTPKTPNSHKENYSKNIINGDKNTIINTLNGNLTIDNK